MPLPDYLRQGLGWPTDDSSGDDSTVPLGASPPPAPEPQIGDLHPAIAQAIGLLPPPVDSSLAGAPPPDMAAQQPTAPLPVTAAPPNNGTPPEVSGAPLFTTAQPQQPPPSRDFTVPVSAFGHGASPAPGAPPTGAPGSPASQQPPKPETPAQQVASAARAQDQADLDAQRANVASTSVAAQEAQAQVANYTAADEKRKQLEAQQQADQDEFAKTHATKQGQLDAINSQIDNYKVDQGKYWNDAGVGTHVGWYIAMALSGLGQALDKQVGPNPVIAMLQAKMKESVEAQMDERAQLQARGARAEHALDKYDAFSKDRQAQTQARLAELDHALAQNVLTTAAKFKAPEVLARGQALAAELEQQSVARRTAAADRATQVQLQQQSNAVAAGHLALARNADARAAWLQNAEYGPGGFKEQELGLKAADEARKMLADQKKKVKEEGVFNPQTADPLLNQRGREMVAQADQIEAVARNNPAQAAQAYVDHLRSQATTPAGKEQVDQLEQRIKQDPATAQQVAQGYASKLRDDARTTEVATIADKTTREKVQQTINYGQNIYDVAGEIKDFLKKDPNVTDREGWGRLQAKFGSLIADEAKFLGARASRYEFDALAKHVLDYDPGSINPFSLNGRFWGSAPAIGQLDGLMQAVRGAVSTELQGHGIKDGWLPSSPQAVEPFSGKTNDEAGQAAEPGWLTRGIRRIRYALPEADQADVESTHQWAADAASERNNAAGQRVIYGLAPEDDDRAKALLAQARSGSNATHEAIVDRLAAPIIANDRPSLSWGLLNLVKDSDPRIYNEILGKLPPMQRQQIEEFDSSRSKLGAPDARLDQTLKQINAARAASGLPPLSPPEPFSARQ